mmetsp:Transcript_58095/g.121424  ORF Transcript_58095/g.121424 Transcript_58095/m.121424 type:complete len:213 (-) Transcript_58095:117-755(-)
MAVPSVTSTTPAVVSPAGGRPARLRSTVTFTAVTLERRRLSASLRDPATAARTGSAPAKTGTTSPIAAAHPSVDTCMRGLICVPMMSPSVRSTASEHTLPAARPRTKAGMLIETAWATRMRAMPGRPTPSRRRTASSKPRASTDTTSSACTSSISSAPTTTSTTDMMRSRKTEKSCSLRSSRSTTMSAETSSNPSRATTRDTNGWIRASTRA